MLLAKAKGYKSSAQTGDGNSSSHFEETGSSSSSPSTASASSAAESGSGAGGVSSEADVLAKEVDHYAVLGAVLGVTTDATEKQLNEDGLSHEIDQVPPGQKGGTHSRLPTHRRGL